MPEEKPGYEAARAELIEVVRALEAGGTTLEESLALWERGERLATICQEWLDGARKRLDAALDDDQDDAEAQPAGSGWAVRVAASASRSDCGADPKTINVWPCHGATSAVSPPASVQVSHWVTRPLPSVTGAPDAGSESTYVVSTCGAVWDDCTKPT